jgi:alpha-tubulin suppressor-like RCC1 family protein
MALASSVAGCSAEVVVFPSPASEPAASVVQVRSGWEASCAVESDGGVACWGAFEEEGPRATVSRIVGLDDVVSVDVSAYPYGFCVLHAAGTVTCLAEHEGVLERRAVDGVGEGEALMVNGWFSGEGCVRNSDDTVSCWPMAPLFDETIGELSASRVEGLSDAASLVRGAPCALRTDGTIWCWGSMGDSDGAARSLLGLNNLISASFKGGRFTLLALEEDGTMWSWEPSFDEDNKLVDSPPPAVIANVPGAVEVDNNIYNSCARTDDGALWCLGTNNSAQLGLGWADDDVVEEPTRATVTEDVAQLSVGLGHMCVLDAGGSLECWGAAGGTGAPDPNQEWATALVAMSGAVSVSAGDGSTCAIDDSGALHCWGRNSHGQLGVGHTKHANTPTHVESLEEVATVTHGWDFTCALDGGGQAWCWGGNEHGQLGLGHYDDEHTPQLVPGLEGILALEAGGQHACALANDGAVWCWGRNNKSQLGTPGGSATPKKLDGLVDVARIDLGAQHSCAIDQAATVWCWGDNLDGEAAPTSAQEIIATPQALAAPADHIDLGDSSSCARLGDDLQCWGRAENATTNLGSIVSMAVNDDRVCAANGDGELHCWGPDVPPTVLTIGSVLQLSGSSHLCALRQSNDGGDVTCVGSNGHGQLGNGSGFVIEPTAVSL